MTSSQCSSIHPRLLESLTACAATNPATIPPTRPQPIALATMVAACRVRELPGIGLRNRECDREEGNAETVVQATLDVESLANGGRQVWPSDDGLAERRVGWRQDDCDDHRFCPREAVEDGGARHRSGHDRQWEPDCQETGRYAVFPAQGVQVDA